MKLTPWFPASVKPARVGVYEKRTSGHHATQWAGWDGRVWNVLCLTPEEAAAEMDGHPTCFPDDEWRGLAEEPKQ